VLMPWTIRNYRVFGALIPLRSNFGLELWLGNNPSGDEVNSFLLHPFVNISEARRYTQLGERAYMADKQREAGAFILSHPGATSRFVLRRAAQYWFAVTDRPGGTWSSSPLYVKALV